MAKPDMFLANKMRHKLAVAKAQDALQIYTTLSNAIIKVTAARGGTYADVCMRDPNTDLRQILLHSWVIPTLREAVSDLTWELVPDMPTQTVLVQLHWT